MSVGFPLGKSDIDNRAGALCLELRTVFAQVKIFNALLAAQGLAGLEALNYSPTDAQTMLTNFSVLDQFRQAFEGTTAIPSAVNVQAFVTPFVGTN